MKYLIEIHHGIGDIVQMTGIIEALYRQDKNAQIDLIVNDMAYMDLFKYDKRVTHFYLINLRTMSLGALLKEVWKMRRAKYDYFFVSCISSKGPARCLAWLVNAKRSYGEQLGNVPVLKAHRVVRNAQLLKSAGLFQEIEHPLLCGIKGVETRIVKSFALDSTNKMRTIGICLGAARPSKDWTNERFFNIIRQLSEEGYRVFLFGKTKINVRQFECVKNCCVFVNKVSVPEMMGLMTECDVVIGGDTGPMHVAAALGVKTITIFGSTNPKYHAPYGGKNISLSAELDCQYCYDYDGEKRCVEYECLKEISVQNVMVAICKFV